MNLSSEGVGLAEIEEKILAAADDIRDRRMLLADGCTCDMSRLPWNGVFPYTDAELTVFRCSGPNAVCDSRRTKLANASSP